MRRLAIVGALLLAVAGCAEKQPFADDQTIAAVSYRDGGGASLTLYTMVNNRTGKGGHSALLINASQRIIFDPAGSFYADVVPERNDVLFGITPAVEKAYRSAHARSTFHVVRQTINVSAEQADVAYRLALANGAVPGAFCANATSSLLARVPGFESIKTTFYPTKLQSQVAQLPGVVTDNYYEGDSADLKDGLERSNAALTQ
ncbi:hypothetical protein ACXYMO_09140 [Arenibacterium sp. CAU 1754]